MTGSVRRGASRRELVPLGVVAIVAACTAACMSAATPTPRADPRPTAVPTVSTVSSTAQDPASQAGPPAAGIAAEGGDPVLGQLGSYIWLERGSDSPWLPGTPIVVGAGEPLRLTLAPAVEVATWRARRTPAGAGDAVGAVEIAHGTGVPAFVAPGPGRWTIEVAVTFADEIGSATYFWLLEVR